MAQFRIRFKPDGSFVVRGTTMSGKTLVRQIALAGTERDNLSDVMKEVVEALKQPAPEPVIAQDRAGEPGRLL